MNNGTGDIWIDINSNLYNDTWANKNWAAPYLPGGCTWFVGARVSELTNNPRNTVIWSGSNWWNSYGESLGYSKGTVLNREYKAVVCWKGATADDGDHVAIIEDIQSDGTIILSEGGLCGPKNDYYRYTPWGCCQIIETTENELRNRSGKVFLGYIYLDVKFPTTIAGSEMSSGYSQAIANGTYYIMSAAASDKSKMFYMDIDGADNPAANATNVILTQSGDGNPPSFDAWSLTYSDGFYTIKQPNTNMSLDVNGINVNSGANVMVGTQNGGSNQKFAIKHSGGNGYTIQAKHSGLAVSLAGGCSSGTNIIQSVVSGADSQCWLFIPYQPSQPIEEGKYIILDGGTGAYELDLPGDTGDLAENANVTLHDTSAPSRYNAFTLTKYPDGYYKFKHSESGKCLDVTNGASSASSNVAIHTGNDSITQRWAIIPTGNGTYKIVSKCNGYPLDADGSSAFHNGTNVMAHFANGGANQTWRFAKAEYTIHYNANGGTGAPADQIKYFCQNITLANQMPTREGYDFVGWGLNASANTVDYAPGATFSADQDLTLYAVWQWKKPMVRIACTINGEAIVDESKPGTFTLDIYTDGEKIHEQGISSYNIEVAEGSRYEISQITEMPGYKFSEYSYGAEEGTVGSGLTDIVLNFITVEEGPKVTLALGDTTNLQVPGWTIISYETSKADIVSMNINGTMQGTKIGTTVITATASNGAKRKTEIEVVSNVTGLSVTVDGKTGTDPHSIVVFDGTYAKLLAVTVNYSNDYRPGYDLVFSLSGGQVSMSENLITYQGDLCTAVPRLVQFGTVLYDGAQDGVEFHFINRSEKSMLTMPEMLSRVEDEAFAGTASEYVAVTGNVKTIGASVLPAGCTVFLEGHPTVSSNSFPPRTRVVDTCAEYDHDYAAICLNNGWEYYFNGQIMNAIWSAWSEWSEIEAAESGTRHIRMKTQYRSASITKETRYTEWSTWSSWSMNSESIPDSALKQQQTRTVYPYYCFICPTCGWHSPYWGDGRCTKGHSIPSSSFEVNLYEITTPKSRCEKYDNYKYLCVSNGANWFYWDDGSSPDLQQPKTQYSYRTRTSYQDSVYGNWSEWSDTEVIATETMAVQTRVMYSYQDRIQ